MLSSTMKFLACVALATVGIVAAEETGSTKCSLACRFEEARLESAQIRCMIVYGFLNENCEYVKKARAENAALNKRLGCPPCPVPTFPPTTQTSLPEEAVLKASIFFRNPICAAAYKLEWEYIDAVDLNCFLQVGFNGDCSVPHADAVAKMNKRNKAIHCPPLPPDHN